MTARQLFEYLPEEYRDVDLLLMDDLGLWTIQVGWGLTEYNDITEYQVWIDRGLKHG